MEAQAQLRRRGLELRDVIDLVVLRGLPQVSPQRAQPPDPPVVPQQWNTLNLPDGSPAWRRRHGVKVLLVRACLPRMLGWHVTIAEAVLQDEFNRPCLFATPQEAMEAADAWVGGPHAAVSL